MAKLRLRSQSSIVANSNKSKHNKKNKKRATAKSATVSSTKRKLPTAKRTGQSDALLRRTILNNFNGHNHRFNSDQGRKILPKYPVATKYNNNINKNWVRKRLNKNKTVPSAVNRNDKSGNQKRKRRSKKQVNDSMVIKQFVNSKLVKIEINFADFVQKKLTTIIGHVDLMRLSQLNENFSRLLINSVNFHVDNIVDKVSIKRRSKLKKTRSAKLEELRNNRIDFNSPESILGTLNLSSILNKESFELLPSYFQFKLTKLLPKKDQEVLKNNVICPKETAFNNEFFNKALVSFSTRLKDGKLTKPALRKLKLVQEKRQRRFDKVKIKYFEPFFKTPKEERLKKPTEEDNYQEGKKFMQTFLAMNDKVDKIINKKPSKIVKKQQQQPAPPPAPPPLPTTTTTQKVFPEMDNFDSEEEPEFPYTADMIDQLFSQEILNRDKSDGQPINQNQSIINNGSNNKNLIEQSPQKDSGNLIEEPYISQYVHDLATLYITDPELKKAETLQDPHPGKESPIAHMIGSEPIGNTDQLVEPISNAVPTSENPICKPILVSIINDTPVIMDDIPTENTIHNLYSQFNTECTLPQVPSKRRASKRKRPEKKESPLLPNANAVVSEPVSVQENRPKRRCTRKTVNSNKNELKVKPKKDGIKFKPIMTSQEALSLFERLTGHLYKEPGPEKVKLDGIVKGKKLTTTIEMVVDGEAPENGPTNDEVSLICHCNQNSFAKRSVQDVHNSSAFFSKLIKRFEWERKQLQQNHRSIQKRQLRKIKNSITVNYDQKNNGQNRINPISTQSSNQPKKVQEINVNGKKFFKITNPEEKFKISLKMANQTNHNQNNLTENGH